MAVTWQRTLLTAFNYKTIFSVKKKKKKVNWSLLYPYGGWKQLIKINTLSLRFTRSFRWRTYVDLKVSVPCFAVLALSWDGKALLITSQGLCKTLLQSCEHHWLCPPKDLAGAMQLKEGMDSSGSLLKEARIIDLRAFLRFKSFFTVPLSLLGH